MTDLSNKSVAELREQAKNIITSLNAFDELADRYRRLEEAQRGVPDGWKLARTIDPTYEY